MSWCGRFQKCRPRLMSVEGQVRLMLMLLCCLRHLESCEDGCPTWLYRADTQGDTAQQGFATDVGHSRCLR